MDSCVVDNDLFNYALMNPLKSKVKPDSLRIVSGYASHAFASGHLATLKGRKEKINVDLLVGMASVDGIKLLDHEGFVSLHEKKEFEFEGSFVCRYVRAAPAVHSKVYVWCKGNLPVVAFAGSANYTNNGFKVASRKETLVECDPVSAYEFFLSCRKSTVQCQVAQRHEFVRGYEKKTAPEKEKKYTCEVEANPDSPFFGYEKIVIPLRNSEGHFGIESGLNWGLNKYGRPRLQNKSKPSGGRRNPDEAYIRLPKKFDCGFFPPYIKVSRGQSAQEAQIRFSVLTDDNEMFSCIRASGGYGKEIETPQDNTELGRWFRKRLGVASGTMITQKIMKLYGRDDVTFYKISDDQFFMDFSVKRK